MTAGGLLSPAISGFLLGASLIIAIGAQNALVLRQGLMRRHVLPVVAVCAASDGLLIALGISGLGAIIGANPQFLDIVLIAGAVFLLVYGALAFRRALTNRSMTVAGGDGGGLWPTLAACLAFTWGNPHVYLDTVILLGGLAGRYPPAGRMAFGAGAVAASVVWFALLGFGARLLVPFFAHPRAWRVLDILIGCVMWGLAAGLVAQLF